MQKESQINKIDRNKIYFLIIVIASLLGINAYLFVKSKNEKNQLVTVTTEKDRLNLEIEKIEVELDRINAINITLNDKLLSEQKLAREKIEELRIALKKGQLTLGDLQKAQEQIEELQLFVKKHQDQIARLEKENGFLRLEKDSLQTTIKNYSRKTDELSTENENLSAKVKIGEALKTSQFQTKAYRVKTSGKPTEVNKASQANKFILQFNVAENSLASQGTKTIYLRIFDPAGNLIAKDNDYFEANGQQMQFSSKTQIQFDNKEKTFTIEWTNPKEFIKGNYNLILYNEGFEMGKSQIKLN